MGSNEFYLEAYILLISILASLVIAYFHAKLGKLERPNWPIILLNAWIQWMNIHGLKNFGEKRTIYFFREQYMSAAFVWFWISAFILIVIFRFVFLP